MEIYQRILIKTQREINLRDAERRMEAPPLIREDEDLFDGYLLHHHDFSTESSAKDTSESPNAKRKVDNGYDLFCVMRKRTYRHNDDLRNSLGSESDFRFENPNDENYCCSGNDSDSESDSDTHLSDSSEFDVISQYVLQDFDLMGELTGSKPLPICNFPCPNEDEGTLVSKVSSQTHNSIFFLSPGEVNEENGVSSKVDQVLSSVSASPMHFQHIIDPQICSGHVNDMSLFLSERKKDKMSCIPGICEDILRCSINKEDPEIPCNSDIFKNDGHTSCAIELMLGDVVSMHRSLEEMSSNYDLRLWNKDEEPIPVNIVPPKGGSSILLETCSLHQAVRCINEYKVHDDNIGIEISPIPLTKTLEGPSRSWSVCGSIAAVRNLPVLEDSSGACSSFDGQLYVNLSSFENRDAKLAQAPSTLYQDEVDGEDDICFGDIDAMIRKLNLVPDDSESCLNREELNMTKHPRHTLLGLEHCTRTSIRRAIMSQGAIAVLHCRDSKHFIRKSEVIIGRSSDGRNVDIDLGKDGYGSKISRRQALVKLENNKSFSLKNLGKRHITVNGEKLNAGQIVSLTSCSSVNIRGIVFLFKINKEAVRQFWEKNTRRNSEDDTKFRWYE